MPGSAPAGAQRIMKNINKKRMRRRAGHQIAKSWRAQPHGQPRRVGSHILQKGSGRGSWATLRKFLKRLPQVQAQAGFTRAADSKISSPLRFYLKLLPTFLTAPLPGARKAVRPRAQDQKENQRRDERHVSECPEQPGCQKIVHGISGYGCGAIAPLPCFRRASAP